MKWKNPKKNERRRYKIWKLSFLLEKYYFEYTAPEISDAINQVLYFFLVLKNYYKKYESEILFQNIYIRLQNKNRDDYKDIMLGYNIDMDDNEFDILTKIKGRLITDTIKFVEPFNKNFEIIL